MPNRVNDLTYVQQKIRIFVESWFFSLNVLNSLHCTLEKWQILIICWSSQEMSLESQFLKIRC